MNRHDNTVAAITGGTQGLGLAIARRLANEGAQGIVIAGRDSAKGEAAAAEVAALGTPCTYVQADVAQPEDCARVVDATLERFGRINAARPPRRAAACSTPTSRSGSST